MDMVKFVKERESVLVALLTAFSYIIAYLYEIGFSFFYKFPASLITINISTMLFGIFFCSLLYAALHITFYSLMKGIDKFGIIWYGLTSALINRFTYWYITLLFYFILPLPPYTLFLACTCILALDYFTYSPNPFKTSRKEYIKILKENIIKETNKKEIKEIKKDFFSLFSISFSVGIMIACYGYSNAKETKEFFTFVKEGKQYAILKKYDNYVIANKTFNNKLTKGTYIFNIEDISGINIEEKVINNSIYLLRQDN
ncbi:hypothetical protein [Enterobacter bugandensis]|uniref:hypothetical protein n=1 Tax=Enterobacter bugandensis TaxID=881260 RepID=UPI000F81FEE9|nr:hypothetical protein [Enterobacter bugandensis]RTN88279.1 hypothetical protein EKN79_16490 [Enterobacter bugandensis]